MSTTIVAMDGTVLALALPHLGPSLRPSSAESLWIMDIYAFMVAGLLITMGTLGDRIGRRRLWLIGAAVFAVASAAAAYSTSAGALIGARAVLGAAGATLAPATLSLIRNMFHDPRQRRFAFGVWTAGFSVGGVAGPLLGGFLLDRFWWGSVFLINVPVMALLLALGPAVLPEFRGPRAGRVDLPSAAGSLAAVLPVIFGVKRIAADGLGLMSVLSIAVGLLVGVAFVRRQRAIADPLIDLGLFRDRRFGTALTIYLLIAFASAGFVVFVAQYLQSVLGLGALAAAVCWVPAAVAMMIGALLAPACARWIQPGPAVGAGLLLMATGFAVLTQVGLDTGQAVVIAGFSLQAAGLGLVSALAIDMMVATAPAERSGAAAAVAETGNVFGGALGIAMLGSIGTAVYRGQITDSVPKDRSPRAGEAETETLAGAIQVAGSLPPDIGPALLHAAREAFVQGMRLSAVIVAVATAVAAVLAMTTLRHVRIDPGPVRQRPAKATGQR